MTHKDRILIVDDSVINRSLLIDILAVDYDIVEVADGLAAIEYMGKHLDEIALILLDIVMPIMDGFEVLTLMHNNGWIQSTPVITITSETSPQYINKAYDLGVTDYISRPFDELTVQRRVQNTIILYAKQKNLEDMVTEQILEKEKNNLLMVEVLSHIVEFRNGESGLHVLHIRIITEFLMKELSKMNDRYHFTSSYIALVMNASALHDIGKITIPEAILNKPGKLTKEEFEIIKTHSLLGAQMLENVPYYQQEELIQIAHDICRWHHERYDGSGYPDGLKGDDIPITAQIVALADVYDALTSKRVYKDAYTHDQAVVMILNGECGAFQPLLLECFSNSAMHLKKTLDAYDTNSLISTESMNLKGQLLKSGSVSNRTLNLLEQERTKYNFFASMSGEIQFEFDYKSNILTFSEWGAMHLGLPEIIVDPYQNDALLQVIESKTMLELREKLQLADGDHPNVEMNCQIKMDGEDRLFKIMSRPLWADEETLEITGTIGKFIDIHDEFLKINQLKRVADQDSLTKLWNHKAARKLVESWIYARTQEQYAMILVDLNFIKHVNDTFKHKFGDDVLRYVAKRLCSAVNEDCIISRVGGDKFMVFLKYEKDIVGIVSSIYNSIYCDYKGYLISLSLGAAIFPQDGMQYETLYKRADQALYKARNNGRYQYRFYSDGPAQEKEEVLQHP